MDPIKSPSVELRQVDYVLVYNHRHQTNDFGKVRRQFQQLAEGEGLELSEEQMDEVTFVRIFCPFDRLCKEAEAMKLEMNLKGCEIASTESHCCLSSVTKKLETDDEADYVSGAFERAKLHLYDGSEYKDTFFRCSQRSYLVHQILINLELKLDQLDIGNFRVKTNASGLLYLLMKKVYLDAFVVHDQSLLDGYYKRLMKSFPQLCASAAKVLERREDSREILNNTWAKSWKFQPLWKIRNYFGEKIAFYFAWVGTLISLLWIPSILGLCVFLFGLYLSATKKRLDMCECELNKTSTAIVNSTLILGLTECEKKSLLMVLAKNVLQMIDEAFNNELNAYMAFFTCIWGSVLLETWKRRNVRLAYEWDVNNYEEAESDKPEFYGTQRKLDPITKEEFWVYPESKRALKFLVSTATILGMMCVIFLTIASVILFRVTMKIVWSCPRDSSDSNCTTEEASNPQMCIILGTIMPSLLSTASVLILSYFYSGIATRLTVWENHRTETDFNDALIIKLFAFNFVNSYAILFYMIFFRPEEHLQLEGLFGMGPAYKDTCAPGNCLSLVSLQVLMLMVIKPCAKFFYDIIMPLISRYMVKPLKKLMRKLVSKFSRKRYIYSNENSAAKLDHKSSYLYSEWTKPPLGDFTLEEFNEKVLLFGYLVMFTAAFPLAPLVALITNLIDVRVDAKRLLWFNRRPVAFIASDIGMWSPILKFLNFFGVITNAFLVSSYTPMGKDKSPVDKLIVLILFEHIVYGLELLIDAVTPDVPSNVRESVRRERRQIYKILEGEIVLTDPTDKSPPQPTNCNLVLDFKLPSDPPLANC